jgi:hypothetical protein
VRELPTVESYFKESIRESAGGTVVFLMPFDPTRQLLVTKIRQVEQALSRFTPRRQSFAPASVGLQTSASFAPTVSIECFAIQDSAMFDVEIALKKALHKPSKKTKKEKFRVGAHGHLFTKELPPSRQE